MSHLSLGLSVLQEPIEAMAARGSGKSMIAHFTAE
jgi:hypothetical protein